MFSETTEGFHMLTVAGFNPYADYNFPGESE